MKKTLLRGEANLIYLFVYTYVIMLGARVCVKKKRQNVCTTILKKRSTLLIRCCLPAAPLKVLSIYLWAEIFSAMPT